MKEFKGTQGKWTSALTYSNFETRILSGVKRIAEVKHYNDGKGGVFKNDPELKEGMANAHLIETAPELLESLQHLLYTAEKLWDNQKPIKDSGVFTVTHPIIEEAKSVINKALGL